MPRTHDWYKLGTSGVTLRLKFQIPLADETEIGNWGGEGYDEDSINAEFPNANATRAHKAAPTLMKEVLHDHPTAEGFVATVTTWTYRDCSFDDPHHGWVSDAYQEDDTSQYGWFDSGTWYWEEPINETG